MFCTVRLNVCCQVNARIPKGSAKAEQLEARPSRLVPSKDKAWELELPKKFLEIVVTWNSVKLNRPLWKTKKFYDSRTVNHLSDTALGKAYAYCNKLLSGKWLTMDEYDIMFLSLLEIEQSDEYRAYPKPPAVISWDLMPYTFAKEGFDAPGR